MKEKILEKISLGVSLLPLTFFIIRHLRIGMEAPWVYIFFAAYSPSLRRCNVVQIIKVGCNV